MTTSKKVWISLLVVAVITVAGAGWFIRVQHAKGPWANNLTHSDAERHAEQRVSSDNRSGSSVTTPEALFSKEEPQPLVNPLPTIRMTSLSQAKKLSLDAPQRMGTDLAYAVVDGQGCVWVFLAQLMSFQFSKGDSNGFLPLAPMPAVGQLGPEALAVTLADDNMPIVIWQAIDPPGTSRIVSSRWTPQGWSRPVTIDTMPSANFTRSFDVLRDAQGRLHLVYDRPLDPPEEYKFGLIAIDAVDLFRPHKAFHACLSDGSWSRPVSTTGPGRFDLKEFHLALDSTGTVCLSGAVCVEKGRSQGYLVRQSWRGGRWSELKTLVPVAATTYPSVNPRIYTDPCGLTHLWHGHSGSRHYQQLSAGLPKDASPPYKIIFQPIIKRLPDGRLALLSGNRLTVWNGAEWCHPVGVEAEDMNVSTPNSILLWQWRGTVVQIQEISLRADANTQESR